MEAMDSYHIHIIHGEYLIKIKNVYGLWFVTGDSIEYEIINFGKNLATLTQQYYNRYTVSTKEIAYSRVNKISSKLRTECGIVKFPEGRFTTIPGDLYEDVSSDMISGQETFENNDRLVTIPNNLYKGKNIKYLVKIFKNCRNLKNIPNDLFKDMVDLESVDDIFNNCSNIENIPEELFKYNSKLQRIDTGNSESGMFYNCIKIKNIPENLFKFNTELEEINTMFSGCTGITNIPENLFRHNSKLGQLNATFLNTGVTNIPENLFRYNQGLYSLSSVFMGTKITNIPENLFKFNTKLYTIALMFAECRDLRSIPERLLKNTSWERLYHCNLMFWNCTGLTYVPVSMFAISRSLGLDGVFKGCTNASNYNSIDSRFK